MSSFIDKIKGKFEAASAAIDNELTVLEGAGGDDPLSDHPADDTDDAAEPSA
ncbi:hypothetical protein [Gordonia hydrophobica]|uniref:Uncharacterized protein n=1 Tax=Gordonia hydrophobica TaxID=40516 RepID=A0ABZ2U473_9ACTN|nr:hypothetical protein [Gordonia hydrophobica]MBM7368112.1 hypothetical protein [Gordonia hydrophobica]